MTRRVGSVKVKAAELDQTATEVPELIRDTMSTALTVPGGQSYLVYTSNDGGDTYTFSLSPGALKTAAGDYQTIYYTGSAWPARTLLSGYSGIIVWDSQQYPGAPAPTAMQTGDLWDMRDA